MVCAPTSAHSTITALSREAPSHELLTFHYRFRLLLRDRAPDGNRYLDRSPFTYDTHGSGLHRARQAAMVTDEDEETSNGMRTLLREMVDEAIQVDKPTRDKAHQEISRWTDAEVRDQWFMNEPKEIINHLLNQDLGGIDEEIHFSPGDINDSI
jgi:hypothetical protein